MRIRPPARWHVPGPAFAFALLAGPALAGAIDGTVRDARTGGPLDGVRLELVGTLQQASSSREGTFSLADVPPGRHRLRATLAGYRRAEVEAQAGGEPVALVLEPLLARVDEAVTVTAQGHERRAFDVPESVSSLESDDLSRRALRSTPEALAGMTGVFVQKTSHGGGSPFIRGLTGNQVLLMVDGIRLSNSTFRYGPNQYLATVAARSIERVEIVRGAGSTLYGSDAIGGVANVLSRELRFAAGRSEASGRVLLGGMSGGMDRTVRAEAEAAGGRWAFHAGADARWFGDLVAGGDLGTEAPSAYDERSADLKALVRASSSTVLTLAYQHVHQSDVPRYDQVAQRGYLRHGFDPQVRQLAYARSRTFLSHSWLRQIEATLSVQRSIEGRFRQRQGESLEVRERDAVETIGLAVEARSAPQPGWRATSGLEVYRDRVASSASSADLATGATASRRGLYPDGATATSLAAFTLHSLDLGRLSLSLGGRFNSFAIAAEDPVVGPIDVRPRALVGNASALFRVAEGQHLAASVNSGFRAPNVSDVGSLGPFDFGVEVPSPDLEPERSLTLELGHKARVGTVASAVALFVTHLSDMIERVETTYLGRPTLDGDLVYRKENVGEARLKGVEAEIEVALPPRMVLAAAAVYAHGQNLETDEPVRRIPPLHGRVALRFSPARPAFAEVEWLWAAKQDRLASGDRADHRIAPGGTPGWSVLNLRAAWDTGPLRLRAGVENLFDEAYRTHGSGIDGVGRAAWASVEASF
jgi:outer membrane receptor protein involved in Fe transport